MGVLIALCPSGAVSNEKNSAFTQKQHFSILFYVEFYSTLNFVCK